MFELGEAPYTDTDEKWDAFVKLHPHSSLLQTAVWARLKSRFGWTSKRVTIKEEGQIVAGAQMLFKSYAWGMIKIAYVPHGPLVDWHNKELVELLFNQLDTAAWQDRAAILKMEPLLWSDEFSPADWDSLNTANGNVSPTDSIQPPRTVRIDITKTEEEILAAMKQKTRYNIRLSAKKGVTVRRGTKHDLNAFYQMMFMTGNRNEFGVHDKEYYEVAFNQFNEFAKGSVALFIAEHNDKPLAGVMAFAWGKQGSYLYGASNTEGRELMPTYGVQWEAMKWAKAQGCEFYDMWGVPDYDRDHLEENFQQNNAGLWGVYRFKRGWGGDVARTVGPVDRVYNNLTYRVYKWRRGE